MTRLSNGELSGVAAADESAERPSDMNQQEPNSQPVSPATSRFSELLGRVAWDAYKSAVGGKAWNGDALPTWEEMVADEKKTQLVNAWKAAAHAVTHYNALMAINETVKSGFAGVMPNGNIVDRRIHPTAIAIQANSSLNVPEPKAP